MMATYEPHPTLASRWTLRIAAFSALLVVTAIILHRLAGMATPVALTLIGSGFAGAGLAVLLAAVAAFQIWRTHALGTAHVVTGLLIALALFAWPAAYLPPMFSLPALTDVSTDTRSPPPFTALAARRGPAANAPAYPGTAAAALQSETYPDLRTFALERSDEEAFEIAREALRRARVQIIAEEPPLEGRRVQEGVIEAVDRTLIIGFYDDIVVRVRGDDRQARIDIRSASRYGRHDLGRNAQRVRALLKEIQARLDATVPGAPLARSARLKRPVQGALPRRPQAGDRASQGRPSQRAPGKSDARREPEPKGQPPAPGAGRARDTQGPQ